MLNFSFQNTTKIHFGEGQIKALSKAIPTNAKVLVTYGGGSIKTNGVYDQVVNALSEHTWYEFSGIEPNPSYDTLMKAQNLIREHNIDFLLAVGGGSVVDGTKFIAAAALFEGDDPWDFVAKGQPIKQALPIGCVLTLPATGSESNTGAVVTRDGNKLPFQSSFVRPLFAVLDPVVTLSLSDRQISNGVVDAFVHTMEQYLTYSVNGKVQDRFAEGLLLTLIEEGPKALVAETAKDLDVRGNIMWAATMALNGLIGAGVPQDWSTHMIGHELTGAYKIDHARTLSIVLPAVMKVCTEAKREKLLQYAERIWNLTDGSEESRIHRAIEQTEAFFHAMQVPTRLSHVDLGEADIDGLIEKLTQHGMVKLGEHGAITPEVSRKILITAL
ncbi:MAG: NADP-dependent alcohol dehydrogenase [Gammaproteobacteria bacterium]|jgi:NADP-dependent alcohol dehydrogenase|uniref:iron-containing alcohol dehydrogenase n=1 Tax=Thalassolituus TaxID=187492 RepID=UPI0009492506|nr:MULTISPECIES: iron-containing alcohol dehydrogenase [Thalassolituus]PHQ83865.1 MAG: NADH-dependent alcohol dehydrogenase [Thalassobium sp.]APR68589.1 NADH-dependent alcohol dehydrogenase [Thalassolituus oleivorans]MBQ0779957.1 iron-containing alcohol dehydrogenase [Thalassolituus oleivorans]MCA6126778.1 aldehyde reductase [Thalassolituus oleivorans 4BN06-13]PHQ84308.1 MAG: NADH-dependent alcohol dehydrogenase [Thalassobium sp.]|tara:strand:+ start:5225 stop:6382 length:1158 start_codon:yes stop_codon:yes gene_type:complete